MQDFHDYERKIISEVKYFAESINSKNKAVLDLSKLANATNELPLSNLAHWESLIRLEFYNALEPSTKKNWRFWGNHSPVLTWLDLTSWDGFRREETLRSLTGAAPNSFFLTLAIRKLNDWVPQVRAAAREKIPLIANESDPLHVANALCITLLNWNSWGRIEPADKDALFQVVSKKEIGNHIKSKIISSSSGPMSSLMDQVGRTPILDNYLGEIADKAIQPSVRARAYRSQFEKRMTWLEGRKFQWTDKRYGKGKIMPIIGEREIEVEATFKELLNQSTEDTSPIVRRVAAEFFISKLEKFGEESIQLAKLFASDKSSAVSERGEFALRKLKDVKN